MVLERLFFQRIFANFLDRVCSSLANNPVEKRLPVEPLFAFPLWQHSTRWVQRRNRYPPDQARRIGSIILRIGPPAPTSAQIDSQTLFHKLFGNLHGVQRGAFEKLVTGDPETESV